jgi:hypothetical protein
VTDYDVTVTGELGFYEFQFLTPKAKRYRSKCLGKAFRSPMGGLYLVCDDSSQCGAIIANMDVHGLSVEANGVDMRGFGTDRVLDAEKYLAETFVRLGRSGGQ